MRVGKRFPFLIFGGKSEVESAKVMCGQLVRKFRTTSWRETRFQKGRGGRTERIAELQNANCRLEQATSGSGFKFEVTCHWSVVSCPWSVVGSFLAERAPRTCTPRWAVFWMATEVAPNTNCKMEQKAGVKNGAFGHFA